MSGKTGKLKFDGCQGNVGELTKSQGSVRGKSCQGKVSVVNFTFGSAPMVSRIEVA